MNAPRTNDPDSGAIPEHVLDRVCEPLNHNKSYLAIGRSRISARGVGFLILCASVPAVLLLTLYLSATYEDAIDKDVLLILVGAYSTAIGSATTAYFNSKTSTPDSKS